jgi:hypothetical protein
MTVEEAKLIWQRWAKKRYYGDEYNRALMLSSYEFRKYPLNIFTLNSKALKIQHAIFGAKADMRKIISSKKKKISRNANTKLVHAKSSGMPQSHGPYNQKTLRGVEHTTHPVQKQTREQRIVETRTNYSSQSRLSVNSKANSKAGTSEKYNVKKLASEHIKRHTISDAELQNVMKNAWAKAEIDKQKKIIQTAKVKRAPLRTQDSINEEILVNNIVSKAWVDVGENKKKKIEMVAHPKPPVAHSRHSIMEANQVSSIVVSAWKKVEEERKKSASKISKIKKKPIRTQESINEEVLVGKIMNEAWNKSGKLKKQAEKMKKKAEENRKKPKAHSRGSIMEEKFVQDIVSKAWEQVRPNDKMHHICENDKEHESSFEESSSDDSDSDGEIPKVQAQDEVRQSRANEVEDITPKVEDTKAEVEDTKPNNEATTRRSRASRKGNKNKDAKMIRPVLTTQKSSPFKLANRDLDLKMNISASKLNEDTFISPVKEKRENSNEDK